jgi:hypothetical protein
MSAGEIAEDNTRAEIRHWLHERFQGERAQEDWLSVVKIASRRVLDQPLDALVAKATLETAIDAYWNPAVVDAFCRDILIPSLRSLLRDLRQEDTLIQDCVSSEAAAMVEEIIKSPGFVRAEWIENFFTEKAVEDVLSDSLYRALRDFSTIVPRLVLRNLPSGRFSPLGLAGNLTEKLAAQLEKVIEPEIRSFLGTGSQKAIRRACDFTVEQIDSDASIQMRGNLFRFALGRSFSFHFGGLSDAAIENLLTSVAKQMLESTRNEHSKRFVSDQLCRLYEEHGQKNLGRTLGRWADELTSRSSLFAELTWPALSSIFASSSMQDWMNALLDELLDEYEG